MENRKLGVRAEKAIVEFEKILIQTKLDSIKDKIKKGKVFCDFCCEFMVVFGALG